MFGGLCWWGPAAVVSRYGDGCVFGVDGMGLRPFWLGEREKEFFFSWEKGVTPIEAMTADPEPLAPGERIAVQVERGHRVRVLRHPEIQRRGNELAPPPWPGTPASPPHPQGAVAPQRTQHHPRHPPPTPPHPRPPPPP